MTKKIVCMRSIESFFPFFFLTPEFLYFCLAFYNSIILFKRVNVNDFLSMTILSPVCLNLSASESLHKKARINTDNRDKAGETSMPYFIYFSYHTGCYCFFPFVPFSILKALMQKKWIARLTEKTEKHFVFE